MEWMNLKNLARYLLRFLLIQLTLTIFSIYYFDNFLIWNFEFKQIIYNNLLQDKERFFPFISDSFVSVDGVIALLIFIFLLILYSTKFYTYVNELSYSMNRNLVGEYFQIYLVWTSYIMVSFFILRFNNLFRGNLVLFSLLVPLLLLFFRNTELLSSLLGRSVTSESYITFNLDQNSKFKKLRIMTFRNNLGSFFVNKDQASEEIISIIDRENKKNKINLIIINFDFEDFSNELEAYLINLNKKVLIISNNSIKFSNQFIYREEIIENTKLIYFNNDIQYGSKFILKRGMDIFLSLILLLIFLPITIFITFLIYFKDGRPILLKQRRVGLHGEHFNMFKFRSMKIDSHNLRNELSDLNKNNGPLFKIENDPRILKGLSFIREYSLDEIPQLINVLKGDMSIVGPRPLFDDDTKVFNKNYMRRLNVMPGITGLLQINERNTSEFETWYKYDMQYIENWSLFLDLEIIVKTPFSMFSKKIKGL